MRKGSARCCAPFSFFIDSEYYEAQVILRKPYMYLLILWQEQLKDSRLSWHNMPTIPRHSCKLFLSFFQLLFH